MKVGDQVICINDSFHPLSFESIPMRPVKNETYTIRDIRYYPELDKTGLLLEEIINPPTVKRILSGRCEPSFNVIRFTTPLKSKAKVVENVEEEVECI